MSVSAGGGPRAEAGRVNSYPSEGVLVDMHGIRALPPRPLQPGDLLVETDGPNGGRRFRCGLVVGSCDVSALHVLWSPWS